MSLASKPSVWFGCTLIIALILVVTLPEKTSPPLEIGGVWLTPTDDGFIVNFQLINSKRQTVPGKGIINLFIARKIYPVGDEIGSVFKESYSISPADFKREKIGTGEEARFIFTTMTPVIRYNEFSPPAESGIICDLKITFLDYSNPDEINQLYFVKKVML